MEKKYNKECICNFCQMYKNLQAAQISEEWKQGMKDQFSNSIEQQRTFNHIEPTN